MAKHNMNQKIVSGVMAALLLSSAAPISAFASEAPAVDYAITETYTTSVSTRSAGTVLDFSYSGATAVRSVDIADLITQATGSAVSAQEAAYLASEGISMVYDEGLSSNLVSVSVSGDSVLTFTASTKTYQAYNGSTIRWIPVSVTIDGKTENFSSSSKGYTASFSGLVKDKLYTATFQYQTMITVSSYAMSSVINYAYNRAQEAIAAENRYEQSKVEYENALVQYQNALKSYEVRYAEYQNYLKAIKAYNTELATYNAYMKKVSAYEAAMATYNKYLQELESYDERYAAYEAELAALPEKQAQYEKYLEYLSLLQNATKQLTALESAFVPDSTGRNLYATLMGDTVAAVLANQNLLVTGGVDARDISNAGSATTSLQNLLTSYQRQGSAEARLSWYAQNYDSLKSNFITLYSSLENLGKNRAVIAYLNNQGKLERYCQFVGQLYIISTALDDTWRFSSSWSYNGYDLYSLVEACQRVYDGDDSAPSATQLPEKMEPVEKPKVPTEPKKPTEVSEPVKTWTEDLVHPGNAPAPVSEPKQPQLSDFASGAPQMPEISWQLWAVVDLVRSNRLSYRTGTVKDVDLTFTASFSRAASISSKPVVTFYDYDGKTVLYSVQVESGGAVTYKGSTPVRKADAQYTYSFVGWTDANGNFVNMSNIQQNTELYAKYTQMLNEYTVTWNVGGESIREVYGYGQMPEYKGDASYRDGLYQYTFTGWSPALSRVTGDAEYTAQYTKSKLENLTYGVTFVIRDQTYYRTYSYGDIPNFTGFETDYVAGGYRYVFTGWSPELTAVTKDTKYVANFEKTFLIPAGEKGDKSADMTVTKTAHIVTTDESVVNASYAVKEALKAGTQLVLEFGDATVTIENAVLRTIPGATNFRLSAKGNLTWEFKITDDSGKNIFLGSDILLALPVAQTEANGGKLAGRVNGVSVGVTVQDGVAYLRLKDVGDITLRPYYSVTVSTQGNGNMSTEKGIAEVGSQVKLNTVLEQGWEIGTLVISVNGGQEKELTLTNGAFIMPNGDVAIRAEFVEADYEIVFVANGVEISRETYRYGDTVKVPDMTGKDIITEGDKTLAFVGWDSVVSSAKEDIVYTARYEERTLGDNPYQSPYNSDKMFTVVLPIVATVFTLGLAAFLFLFIRKKKYGKGIKDLKTDIPRWTKIAGKRLKRCGAYVKAFFILAKEEIVKFFSSLGKKNTPNDKK